MTADAKVPRRMLQRRAIQIGLKGSLSSRYVGAAVAIVDVTELAHKVRRAHQGGGATGKGRKEKVTAVSIAEAMAHLVPELPAERPYLPHCSDEVLQRLGMQPGPTATAAARLGRGKACL